LTFHVNVDNEVWNAVFKTPVLSSLLLDFLFLYVIISVSLFRSNISKFKYKAISSLGEISYGIYMYHMIIVFGSMHFLKKYLTQFNTPWNHIVYYTIVLASTILIAALSKHFFENYFLSLRNKFDIKRHK
jgi:peptidoglycan/LPS O-acetylase OafA/YrhL